MLLRRALLAPAIGASILAMRPRVASAIPIIPVREVKKTIEDRNAEDLRSIDNSAVDADKFIERFPELSAYSDREDITKPMNDLYIYYIDGDLPMKSPRARVYLRNDVLRLLEIKDLPKDVLSYLEDLLERYDLM